MDEIQFVANQVNKTKHQEQYGGRSVRMSVLTFQSVIDNLLSTIFSKEEAYDLSKYMVFQDNASAIKMLKYGRDSCSGR